MISKGFRRSLLSVGIMTLILGLNAWLNTLHKDQTKNPLISEHLIDEYMDTAQVKQYNKEGKLSETLNIDRAYHVYGQPDMFLQNPKLLVEREDGETWVITSLLGKAIKTSEKPFNHLELTNDVEITLDNQPRDHWLLQTQALTILPHEERAFTLLNVTLTSEQAVIKGLGMESQLKSGHIELKDQVKSTYETSTLS